MTAVVSSYIFTAFITVKGVHCCTWSGLEERSEVSERFILCRAGMCTVNFIVICSLGLMSQPPSQINETGLWFTTFCTLLHMHHFSIWKTILCHCIWGDMFGDGPMKLVIEIILIWKFFIHANSWARLDMTITINYKAHRWCSEVNQWAKNSFGS